MNFRCFLALLLVAAILWKIKQKYDRYRRRQRLFVEMEQMASRPFGTVLVELEKLPTLPSGGKQNYLEMIKYGLLLKPSLSALYCRNVFVFL